LLDVRLSMASLLRKARDVEAVRNRGRGSLSAELRI